MKFKKLVGGGSMQIVNQTVPRALRIVGYRVEQVEGALWLPPADLRPLLRMGNLVERAGARVAPQLSGVLLIEAVKDVYAALPAGKRARRRMLLATA